MQVRACAGTPHHLESKTCKAPGEVKRFLRTKLLARQEWASKYNLALKERLIGIQEEIDSVPVNALKVGDVRRWEATDEHTGVTFVFEIVKEKP